MNKITLIKNNTDTVFGAREIVLTALSEEKHMVGHSHL